MDYNVFFADINDLKPYENNAKLHPPEQIARIAESLRHFGWQQEIVIDGENRVIIGHGRLLAAKQLGIKQVPCKRVEGLSEAEIDALRIADNKVAESTWDTDRLNEELAKFEGLDDLDMSLFGFMDTPEIDAIELDEPEMSEEKRAKESAKIDAATCKCPKCGFVFEKR